MDKKSTPSPNTVIIPSRSRSSASGMVSQSGVDGPSMTAIDFVRQFARCYSYERALGAAGLGAIMAN